MSVSPPKKKNRPTPQQLLAADPARSIWVSANAGSGKTHVLVERVVRLMLDGAKPDSILCITYTKAAAAEMAGRLFERLGAWAGLTDEALAQDLREMGELDVSAPKLQRARQLFTLALETPGGLKIQTIHAFCERLLHLFPVEAGISPGFAVMEERESAELQSAATRFALDVAQKECGGLYEAFNRLSQLTNAEQFSSLMKDYVEALRSLSHSVLRTEPQIYRSFLCSRMDVDATETAAVLRDELTMIDRALFQNYGQQLAPFDGNAGETSARLLAVASQRDPFEALLELNTTEKDRTPRKSFMKKDVATRLPHINAFLEEQRDRFCEKLFKLRAMETIEASTDAYALAKAILARIEEDKRRIGHYDFQDLIARTAQLLSSNISAQWVLYKLDAGLEHILLDESQDTGRDQWNIITRLSEEFFSGQGADRPRKRTMFVVGDQKQSIYSFQGASAEEFKSAFSRLTGGDRLERVRLDSSYRSLPEILKAVDAVFDNATLTQAGIAFEEGERHLATRKGQGLVALWQPVPHEKREASDPWARPTGQDSEETAKQKLATMIATKVEHFLSRAEAPASAGDILILFRNRSGAFPHVMSALRARNIPVAGADRLNLIKSIAVKDLLMLIQWLLLPQDDHALAVILKSPLVPAPFDDAALFSLAHGRASQSLWSRLRGENAEHLHSLLELAKELSPFDLISRVVLRQRRDIFARLGSEGIEAVEAFLSSIREHELLHGASLAGFRHWFMENETTLKREMDKAQGEVRLMTIHGAKGLQARIVILADVFAEAGGDNSKPQVYRPKDLQGLPFWLLSGSKPKTDKLLEWEEEADRAEEAESLRLLYVAMTRAEDELYITGYQRGNSKPNAWWALLSAKLGAPASTGEAVQVLRKPRVTASKDEVPHWLLKPAPREEMPIDQSVSLAAHPRRNYDPAAAKHGKSVHRLLEELGELPRLKWQAHAAQRAKSLGLTESEAERLAKGFASDDLSPFLGPESKGEADIFGIVGKQKISGRIDRLCISESAIWLLDYKTDRKPPLRALQPEDDYHKQMLGYAGLLRAAYPGRKVNAAIWWTATQKLEQIAT